MCSGAWNLPRNCSGRLQLRGLAVLLRSARPPFLFVSETNVTPNMSPEAPKWDPVPFLRKLNRWLWSYMPVSSYWHYNVLFTF